MTDADRKYFKDKADNDKHRYLAESRKFYDEVARIGQQNTEQEATSSAKTGGKAAKGKAGAAQQMEELEHVPVSPMQGPADGTSAGKKRLAVSG